MKKLEQSSKRREIQSEFASLFSIVISVVAILQYAIAADAMEPQIVHSQIPAVTARLQPIGPLKASEPLNLAIGLPLRNKEALTNLLRQLYDPASPEYRHFLTPEQFTERFGPTKQDYRKVVAFAEANGLEVTRTYPNRLLVDVNGSVSDVERTMHVTMHVYQHPTENRTFYGPDREPSLDLGVPVLRIIGLDNYERPHPLYRLKPLAELGKSMANGSGPGGNYMGYDFRHAYAPGVSLSGAGQTVALFEMDGYYPGDIAYYETANGLPDVTLTNVLLGGATGVPSDPNAVVEVSLDIEMAISMAPQLSRVMVYEAPLTSVGAYDILNQMATDDQAKQISSSWVIDRIVANPVPDQIYLEYATQGQSFFQASGDQDAYVPSTFQTADNPYITTGGGTTLTTTSPGVAYGSETVWQWGGGTGSGGGISASFAIPTYQQGIDMTANQGSTTMRNVPDVALTADNVYVRAQQRCGLHGRGRNQLRRAVMGGLCRVDQSTSRGVWPTANRLHQSGRLCAWQGHELHSRLSRHHNRQQHQSRQSR